MFLCKDPNFNDETHEISKRFYQVNNQVNVQTNIDQYNPQINTGDINKQINIEGDDHQFVKKPHKSKKLKQAKKTTKRPNYNNYKITTFNCIVLFFFKGNEIKCQLVYLTIKIKTFY